MHIALFGGAFDPPHLAHQSIARYLIDQNLANQVWFVPVYHHPWASKLKKLHMSPYNHRLAMIKLQTEPNITAAEYKNVSFTYPTITYFEQKYPQHTFSWVMGSEYLPKFDLFLQDHPKLADKHIFIYPREGHALTPITSNMTPLPNAPLVTISSSQIRQLIQEEKLTNHLITPKVKSYIKHYKLYL